MSQPQPTHAHPRCPDLHALRRLAHQRLDCLLDFCTADHCTHDERPFLAFETDLFGLLLSLGQLLAQLFLLRRHLRLDLAPWLARGFRVSDRSAPRTLQTPFGPLEYRRAYLVPKQGNGPGIHPLDAELGLTRDSFSPLLVGWFCRLATRLSFRLAGELGGMFLSWVPAPSTVQEWVLGLARPAHLWLSTGPLPQGDGEVLVIEFDGKAAPTATPQELAKRRGPRAARHEACDCGCQRHRGRCCRKARGPKKKRKRGDKSKNGRSATLVVMYTLVRGEDGRLHGPINKKVYGSFSSRKVVLRWAREQATRRGFGPDTGKTVQVVVDGEVCLEQQVRALFPRAILTLDVRHAQERLWRVGRLLHAEGSQELAAWAEPLEGLLYQGEVGELLVRLGAVSFVGPGSRGKRQAQEKAINYLRKREGLMKYGEWREQDLVLASGVVEGAARYVIGERLDNSGMRWIVDRAEAVLLLRCVEVNGDFDAFFAWSDGQRRQEMLEGRVTQIRSRTPTQLPQEEAASAKRRQRRRAAKPAPQAA
jgi:hypothetical protein